MEVKGKVQAVKYDEAKHRVAYLVNGAWYSGFGRPTKLFQVGDWIKIEFKQKGIFRNIVTITELNQAEIQELTKTQILPLAGREQRIKEMFERKRADISRSVALRIASDLINSYYISRHEVSLEERERQLLSLAKRLLAWLKKD